MGEGNLGERSEKSKGTGKREARWVGKEEGRKSREGEVWALEVQ